MGGIHGTNFLRKTHSEETKEKISNSKKGQKPSNMRRIRVGDTEYNSLTDCAKDMVISTSLVVYRIKSTKYDYTYI